MPNLRSQPKGGDNNNGDLDELGMDKQVAESMSHLETSAVPGVTTTQVYE